MPCSAQPRTMEMDDVGAKLLVPNSWCQTGRSVLIMTLDVLAVESRRLSMTILG